MKTILNPEVESDLSEIEQTMDVKFSYAVVIDDQTIQRQHEWCKCRDFLGDVLFSNKYKKPITIYRFNASYERIPLADGDLTMLIKFPSSAIQSRFLKNYVNIVHNIECLHNIPLTKVEKDVDTNTILITINEFWRSSIPAISFYTYLIKCACYKYTNVLNWMEEIRNKMGATERQYAQRVSLHKIILTLRELFDKPDSLTGWDNEATQDTYIVHNTSGFCSLFQSQQNNSFSRHYFKGV